jgi:hypothetical protein
MRSPPQWAEIKPVAVRMNVLRDSSVGIEIFLLWGESGRPATDCKAAAG